MTKPFDKQSDGGLFGQGRPAPSLGGDDPRLRRNAQAVLSPEMLGAGLTFDQDGRITLKTKEDSAVGTDDDGYVELFTDGSIEQSPGSRTALKNTFSRIMWLLTGGRARGQSPQRMVLEDIHNQHPHEVEGRDLREVARNMNGRVETLMAGPPAHSTTHESGGSDAILGNLDANARVNVQDATNPIGTRRAINFEKSGTCPVAFSFLDEPGDERVTVTLESSITGSGPDVVLSAGPTISNPILTQPTIADFTNAGHDHLDADDGGTLSASAIASGTMATARLGSGSASSSTVLKGDSTWGAPPAGTGSFLAAYFLTSASGTHTVGASTNKIRIIGVGGGGGGGGCSSSASNGACAGGGSAGSMLIKTVAVTPSTGYSYTCGTVGSAGANTGGTGGTGGTSTFIVGATTYTCNGGLGGVGQTFGTGTAVALGGASPAVSTNGDVNNGGDPGNYGIRASGTVGVAGGGGSCPPFGSGGSARSTGGAGNAGVGYGAGGGGGCVLNGSGAVAGATGQAGAWIVEEYA